MMLKITDKILLEKENFVSLPQQSREQHLQNRSALSEISSNVCHQSSTVRPLKLQKVNKGPEWYVTQYSTNCKNEYNSENVNSDRTKHRQEQKCRNVNLVQRSAVVWASGASSQLWWDSGDDAPIRRSRNNEDIYQLRPYTEDIYRYLRLLEATYRLPASYILNQYEFRPSTRCILVDWIAEVCAEYELEDSTLHLAVAYIDRYISSNSVPKKELQLVGAASLLIATKHEEMYFIKVSDIVYVTDDAYDVGQIIQMELRILKSLSYRLSIPTSYGFVRHLCSVAKVQELTRYLAQYICEISMLKIHCVFGFLPSEIAAASIVLANFTLDSPPWNRALQECSGYKLNSLMKCVRCLCDLYKDIGNCPQQVICEKYGTGNYHCVSRIAPPHLLIRFRK